MILAGPSRPTPREVSPGDLTQIAVTLPGGRRFRAWLPTSSEGRAS